VYSGGTRLLLTKPIHGIQHACEDSPSSLWSFLCLNIIGHEFERSSNERACFAEFFRNLV
jgi:hypothetical protein